MRPLARKRDSFLNFKFGLLVTSGYLGLMSDLGELVSYHVGMGNLAEFAKVKSQYVPEPFPTWTILDIAGLARPGLIIEIKAVAVAPS
jgi:enamine deaminase RidA (YjgF/YER057c/UK114 family)